MFKKKFALLSVIVFDVLFLARTFAISPCEVSGPSMNPSFHDGDRILVNSVVYGFHSPERGDVVVVRMNQESEENVYYIKRVIGMPGDTLEVKDGHVFRNGKELDEPYVQEYMYDYMKPVKVPEDKIFVMGDNRNKSLDSRDPKIGMLPISKIIGRVDFKL